jgi:lipopolysaccharide heptosyltransferase II
MKRILIVKMWAMGDILMGTPLLRALKSQYPDCSITWFADKRYSDILEGNPLIDGVIAFDSSLWRRYYRYGQLIPYIKMSNRMRSDLVNRRFDVVINMTAEKWWTLWFNVAPIRIGLFPREEPGYMGRFYTSAIPRTLSPRLHNSEHYTLPAKALGIPQPWDLRMSVGVDDENRQAVSDFLQAQAGYQPELPIIILHPGTSHYTKNWPAASFATVAKALTDRYNIVITGSPSELALAEEIVGGMGDRGSRAIIAAGAFSSVRGTVALVESAAIVVTGDTSVLHIASALETPLIGLYGSTRPGDNAPLFGPNVLLMNDAPPCAPCYTSSCRMSGDDFMACMRGISPALVLQNIENLAGNSRRTLAAAYKGDGGKSANL